MEVKNKQTGKKFIVSMMLGLSLASAAALGTGAFAADLTADDTGSTADSTTVRAAASQSIADEGTDSDTLRQTYGGCGLPVPAAPSVVSDGQIFQRSFSSSSRSCLLRIAPVMPSMARAMTEIRKRMTAAPLHLREAERRRFSLKYS